MGVLGAPLCPRHSPTARGPPAAPSVRGPAARLHPLECFEAGSTYRCSCAAAQPFNTTEGTGTRRVYNPRPYITRAAADISARLRASSC